MKSIKQQYIDLTEGRMSQANFMRNLRMTMPQYITNVTSFNDSVKILRNKGILSEAESKWENTSGKSMYDQFNEIDNLNGQEVLIGIDAEMEKDHELTKEEATKIVIKNLKKNPLYYTAEYMSGKEGYEPEYISKSTKPETQQMTPVKGENTVDKANEMKPVKGIEKAKKDSDKATAEKYKTSGISLMSLVAKTVRGVKKMDATGEKMKTIKEGQEGQYTFNGYFMGTQGAKVKQQIPDAEIDEGEEDGQGYKTTVISPTKSDEEIRNIVDGIRGLKSNSDNVFSRNPKTSNLKKTMGLDEVKDEDIVKKYNEMFGKNPQTKFADVAKALNIPEDQVQAALATMSMPKFESKKLTKEYLLQMIQEELAEILGDGRDNVTDVTGEND